MLHMNWDRNAIFLQQDIKQVNSPEECEYDMLMLTLCTGSTQDQKMF